MTNCKITIYGENKTEKASCNWDTNNILVYDKAYEKGDYILLETDKPNSFIDIRLDDTMLPTIIFMKEKTFKFIIPFDEQKFPYSPKSFAGELHMITAKVADDEDIYKRKDLSLNPYDNSYSIGVYPHASANIETRGETVFAARNVIDGVFANASHGQYPFHSWGINQDPEAKLEIDLGLECTVDEVRLTLRADFPHDNYWTQGTLTFSDGSKEIVKLIKSDKPQAFKFAPKQISSLSLNELIKSDEPSPFPALTHIEVIGTINK